MTSRSVPAAAHVLRFADDARVGDHYRGAGEIRWLLQWPSAPFWPDADLAGWITERSGTLFIRRDQLRDMARINERVRAAMREGDCVGLFPEGLTTEGDVLLRFHSSLFEPAVANEAHIHAAAIRYERADGTLCREASFRGERTFMESLALIIGERAMTARIRFAPAFEADGAHRREVARMAHAKVATLLGLEPADSAPRTAAGPRAASR